MNLPGLFVELSSSRTSSASTSTILLYHQSWIRSKIVASGEPKGPMVSQSARTFGSYSVQGV